ncbi:MAG: DHH family phosphoesterase [Lachnospiraceae bacterium]|jgi:phosphoesterase RecJ-like protein
MKKFEEYLSGIRSLAVTGHVNPDGDATGAVLAVWNYMKENHPEIRTDVYLEAPAKELMFLPGSGEIRHEALSDVSYDLFMICDCSTLDRIEPFVSLYNTAGRKLCVDHHKSNEGDFADDNEVYPNASSTCEVLYDLMGTENIGHDTAECLYTGIVHDTGVFKYSSTSRHTMEAAGDLMSRGLDTTSIIDNSFYSKTYIQNQILGRALLESVVFFNGKCIFSVIPKSVMEFYGVTGGDLSGIIEQLRLTEGVEVAIFLYETDDGVYKVSLRSKKYIDVSDIAKAYGGGGHARAAGFSATGRSRGIINEISAMIEKQYESLGAEAQ